MQVKYTLGYFIILLCLWNVHSFAQERFEQWIKEDQLLISRSNGSRENQILIDLSSGKETNWKGDNSNRPVFESSLSLKDGSIIQLLSHDLYIIDKNGSKNQLTQDDSEEKNPKLSFDRSKIAYTKDHNLYVYDLNTMEEKQLTTDGSETTYNGWASWVYYEEILGRSSHYASFWWSPDSHRIAFLRFDDSPVPTFPLFRSEGQHGSLEIMHYPKAGDPNPDAQFGIVNTDSGDILWVREDSLKDQYSALPYWSPDGKYLIIQELNRSQDTLDLVRVDPVSGARKLIYRETQPTWVDFFEDLVFINNEEFLIRSNARGWYNLYRFDLDGNLLAELTPVEWRVTKVDFIDIEKRVIYFYGTGKKNTDLHFFRVDFDGQNLVQITQEPGWHSVTSSPGHQYFLDEYSSLTRPTLQKVLDKDGHEIYQIKRNEENQNAIAGVKVEELMIPTEDGFDLPGYWVLPKEFNPNKKYPVVFEIYGGPDAGTVRNKFRDYSADFYSNHDIIRMVVDHRGSGKFGKKGMDYMHRNLGKWEIEDLITAVKWLRRLSYIDSTKVAITGGSYGGYVTAMALTYGSQYFTHGISLYPVTDWHLYDNVYTERYMDKPEENPEGYEFGSAIEHAYQLKGKLLIVHGMMDDNVHMQNTVQFINQLQDLGKDFELMMYPGERHGWGGAKRSHLSKLINNFWKENLLSQPVLQISRP